METRTRSALERALVDYLTLGGFPEVQGFDHTTRHRLLQDYAELIQVRADAGVPQTAERELRSLAAAGRHFRGRASGCSP